MSYSSRRPNVILPNNTMFVPNHADLGIFTTTGVVTAASVANAARYVPFSPPYDTAVQSISAWCASGTTQNFDLGLYDEAFTRLGSLGSTGIASTTGIKTWTPSTPIPVYANTTYFAAFVCSSATPTWVVHATAAYARGVCTEATAMPLPATATPGGANLTNAIQILKIVFA